MINLLTWNRAGETEYSKCRIPCRGERIFKFLLTERITELSLFDPQAKIGDFGYFEWNGEQRREKADEMKTLADEYKITVVNGSSSKDYPNEHLALSNRYVDY